jgi:phosphoserine phosphatase
MYRTKNTGIKMLQRKDVVVFDFDGTLSASDSNFEFFKYCFKHSIRPWLYLPLVIAGLCGKVCNPSGIWWRQTLRKFINQKMVHDFSADFIKQHKKNRFGWARDQVAKEKSEGNKVVLVSASPDYLITDLVSDMKFDAVICSKMYDEKPWKYKFLCWGKNKVIALDKWARDNKYIPNVVRSYSDSESDMPIMKIAKNQIWINPKTGIRK